MTLPLSSNSISMGQVNTELNLSATAPISLNDPAVRTLFIKNGDKTTISLADGWGKSNIGAVTNLAVTPNTTTVLSTTVTWVPPATGTISSYSVYAKTAADPVTKKGLQAFSTAPFPTTATLTNLSSGTAYTVYVETSNASASTSATVPVTTLPYSFPFTAVTNSNFLTVNTSNEATITGFPNSWPAIQVSVTASAGNAYFAVSQTQGGTTNFTTTPNTMAYYAANASGTLYVKVRITSSATFSGTVTATLTVGDVSSVYSVTTRTANLTPSNATPIIFITQTDVPISTTITSAMLTLNGLEPNFTSVPISVTGGSYGITDASGTLISAITNQASNATVSNTGNLYLKAQVISSGSFSSNAVCTVTIGTATATFTTTTTSSVFTIAARSNQTINTLITSATTTVTGLQYSTSYTITVTGDTGFAVDAGTSSLSGTFGSSITVTSTSTGTLVIAARVRSSTAGSTTTSCTVSIGSYKTGIFNVTTPIPDTSPVFDIGGTLVTSFTSITNAPFNTIFNSTNTVRVTSLEPNFGISISVAGGSYAVGISNADANTAAFTTSSATFTTSGSGELYIRAQVTSGITFASNSTCTITVGSGSITFTATTTTSTISITSVTNALLNSLYTSATITVNGLPYNASGITVTQPNGIGTVDAGTTALSGVFATSKSNITATSTGTIVVAVQLTSSGSASTAFSADISVNFTVLGSTYSKIGTYTVTTKTPVTNPPTPSQFVFTAQTARERSTSYTSNQITITGLETNYSHTITASGTNATVAAGQSSVGTAGTSVSVTTTNGTIVIVAYITTGTSFLTDYICTVGIGTLTSDFKVTTRGALATPTFSPTAFPSLTGQTTNTTVLSSAITVTGLEPSFTVAISVLGGGSYATSTDLNTLNALTSASFTSSTTYPTTDPSGRIYIRAGAVSSFSNLTAVTTRVYVGTGTADFSVTTAAAVPSSITLGFSGTSSSTTTLTISAGAGSTPTSYYYARYTDAGYSQNGYVLPTPTASNVFTVSLPNPSTTYYLIGYASVAGLTGSGTNSVTSLASPPTTITIGFSSTNISGTTVTITSNNTPTSYMLYEFNSNYTTELLSISPNTTGGNVFTISGKTNNTTYYYKGTASNAGGTSSKLGDNSFTTTLAAPGTVSITKGTITYNSVALTFSTSGTNVGTPSSYTLYTGAYSGDPNPTSTATGLGTNPTISLTASATAYTRYFTAKAFNTAGGSASYASYIQVDVPAQPPAAPSTISITFPVVTSSSFTLRVNVGGGGAANTWYVQQYSNANYNVPIGSQLSSTSSNDFVFSASGASTYYFGGWASNGGGTATAAYNSVLTVPASVTISVGTVTYNSAPLTFTTQGSPASYSVWYSTTNANYNTLTSLLTDTTSNPASVSLSASTSYYFTAKAKNATGSSASYGPYTALVTTPAQPVAAPTGVSLGISSVTTTNATFIVSYSGGGAPTSYIIKAWTNSNYNVASSFTPQQNGTNVTWQTSNTFTVTNLVASTAYYFTGLAANAGAPSGVTTGGGLFTTKDLAPIGTAIAVSTAATTTTVTLTVSISGGTATSYWIEQYSSSAYSNTPVTYTAQATGVFPLTGLTANTPYYFKGVAASNSGTSIVRSAGANPTFTTASPPAPGAVTISSATVTAYNSSNATGTIQVSFTGGANATSFTGSGTSTGVTVTSTGTSSPLTFTGVPINTEYTFSVAGVLNSVTGTAGTSSKVAVIATPVFSNIGRSYLAPENLTIQLNTGDGLSGPLAVTSGFSTLNPPVYPDAATPSGFAQSVIHSTATTAYTNTFYFTGKASRTINGTTYFSLNAKASALLTIAAINAFYVVDTVLTNVCGGSNATLTCVGGGGGSGGCSATRAGSVGAASYQSITVHRLPNFTSALTLKIGKGGKAGMNKATYATSIVGTGGAGLYNGGSGGSIGPTATVSGCGGGGGGLTAVQATTPTGAVNLVVSGGGGGGGGSDTTTGSQGVMPSSVSTIITTTQTVWQVNGTSGANALTNGGGAGGGGGGGGLGGSSARAGGTQGRQWVNSTTSSTVLNSTSVSASNTAGGTGIGSGGAAAGANETAGSTGNPGGDGTVIISYTSFTITNIVY
jgi:hypothetical protein